MSVCVCVCVCVFVSIIRPVMLIIAFVVCVFVCVYVYVRVCAQVSEMIAGGRGDAWMGQQADKYQDDDPFADTSVYGIIDGAHR